MMGLGQDDWWFTLIRCDTAEVCGIVNKRMFVELYQAFYIAEQESGDDTSVGRIFRLNAVCPTEEFPRYKRKLDCWAEYTSRPETAS
jgi:hypothetical protein